MAMRPQVGQRAHLHLVTLFFTCMKAAPSKLKPFLCKANLSYVLQLLVKAEVLQPAKI